MCLEISTMAIATHKLPLCDIFHDCFFKPLKIKFLEHRTHGTNISLEMCVIVDVYRHLTLWQWTVTWQINVNILNFFV